MIYISFTDWKWKYQCAKACLEGRTDDYFREAETVRKLLETRKIEREKISKAEVELKEGNIEKALDLLDDVMCIISIRRKK